MSSGGPEQNADGSSRAADMCKPSPKRRKTISKDSEFLRCVPCQKTVNSVESYHQHISSLKHKSKMRLAREIGVSSRPKILHRASTNLSKTRSESKRKTPSVDQTLCCDVCQKKLNSPQSYQQHAASQKHKRKILLAKAIEVQAASEFEKSIAYRSQHLNPALAAIHNWPTTASTTDDAISQLEELCKTQSAEQSRLASTEALITKSRLQQALQILEGASPDPDTGAQPHSTEMNANSQDFRCDPCGKVFSGQAPYSQHIVSEKHKKKFLKLGLDPTPPPALQEMAKTLNSANPSPSTGAGPVTPRCIFCQISFANNVTALAHFASPAHQARAGSALAPSTSPRTTSEQTQQSSKSNDEAELVKRILEQHQRSFLLCQADERFADFVRRNDLFQNNA